MKKPLLIALLTSLPLIASHSAADALVTVPEPDWPLTFKPFQHDPRPPQLKPDEFPLLDAIRPQLDNAKYRQAMDQLSRGWPAEDASAALLYIRAQISTQLGNYDDARRDYQDSIQQHGDYLLAAQSLAGLSLTQGDGDSAQQHLAQAIALGGQSADLFGQLGYLNLRNHSAYSAVAAYQRAYALAPDNKNWQQGLLMALTRSGAHRQADLLIDELLQNQPDSRDLWLHKANAALAADDTSKALSAMEVAVRLGEREPQNLQLASQLNLQAGNISRAIELVETHVELLNNYSFVQPILGWLSSNDRWRQLEQLLTSCSRQQSSYSAVQRSHLRTEQARLALHRERASEGRKHLLKALELDPANGNALLLLAEQRRLQQRLSQADMLLSRAATLAEHRETALLKRAQLAYQRSLYREAFELLNTVLKENPARRDLIENMDILQRLIRQQS